LNGILYLRTGLFSLCTAQKSVETAFEAPIPTEHLSLLGKNNAHSFVDTAAMGSSADFGYI
jgi:hypothetical protein